MTRNKWRSQEKRENWGIYNNNLNVCDDYSFKSVSSSKLSAYLFKSSQSSLSYRECLNQKRKKNVSNAFFKECVEISGVCALMCRNFPSLKY